MIIVDTSVWVEHFRRGDATLVDLLNRNRVLAHSFVIGELSLGNLNARSATMGLLNALPMASVASDEEILHIIATKRLAGHGIGLVDAHLIASAMMETAQIYTRDKKLGQIAQQLKLKFAPTSG